MSVGNRQKNNIVAKEAIVRRRFVLLTVRAAIELGLNTLQPSDITLITVGSCMQRH